jgi:hypothetical protein
MLLTLQAINSSSTLTGGSLLFSGRLRECLNVFRRGGNRGLSYLIMLCSNRFFISDRVIFGGGRTKHIKSSKHSRLFEGIEDEVESKESGKTTNPDEQTNFSFDHNPLRHK